MATIKKIFLPLMVCALFSCLPDNDLDQQNDIPNISDIDPNQGNMNPNLAAQQELGELLFWDPILSGEFDVACATCHHPNFGWADGRALPIGVGGEGIGPNRIDATIDDIGVGIRNSPSVLNTAFNGMDENGNFNPANAPMFWDNRARSLEAQALMPIQSFEEMRGHAYPENVAVETILERLRSNDTYPELFVAAFGNNNPVSDTNLGIAIAEFERTIIAIDSPFDRFQDGDQNAMTQAQIRGMNRFDAVGCNNCHSGPMFSDFQLHNLGVPDNNALAETDAGSNGTYEFRTPTLRNLAFTGPYFHNGVGGNLQQTITFYRTVRQFANGNGNGGNGGNLQVNENVNRNDIDPDIMNLGNINGDDIQDLVVFLEALNDPAFDRTIPNSVPSGLPPGGN